MSSISDKNWIKGATGTIILGLITAAIYDYIKNQPIFSSLYLIAEKIWDFIIKILFLDLKLWVIIVVISFYKISKCLIIYYQKNKIPDLPKNRQSYQSADFENWKWKWQWKWDTNEKKWVINNLWPYCKKCDIKLLNKSSVFEKMMKCPKCNQTFRENDLELDDYKAVESVVYDNIEKNRI